MPVAIGRSPFMSRLPCASLWSAPIMQTDTQDGSRQCMHCCFMYVCCSPLAYALMMFFVVAFRSFGASY